MYINMMQHLQTNFPTRNKSIKTDLSCSRNSRKERREKEKKTNPNQPTPVVLKELSVKIRLEAHQALALIKLHLWDRCSQDNSGKKLERRKINLQFVETGIAQDPEHVYCSETHWVQESTY